MGRDYPASYERAPLVVAQARPDYRPNIRSVRGFGQRPTLGEGSGSIGSSGQPKIVTIAGVFTAIRLEWEQTHRQDGGAVQPAPASSAQRI